MSILKKILYAILLIVAIIFIYTNIAKATTVKVTTETLNLRAEPSTSSNIVALISEGQECEVLGEEGDWYQVSYGDYTGYVSKEYVEVVGDSSSSNTGDSSDTVDETDNNEQTSSEETTNETVQTQRRNVTATTTSSVSVRITPLIHGSVIETLSNNTEVTVINQLSGWVYIQTDTISGWVRIDTLDIEETETNEVTSDTDNSGDTDTDSQNDDTTDVSDNTSSDFTERTMYTIDYVNIRKEPSSTAEVLMIVTQNTALNVVGESGNWYEVETSQGNAYVSKDVMSDTEIEVTNRGSVDRTSSNKTEEEAEVSNTSTSNSSTSSTKGEEVVAYAKKFLGVPYVYGGASSSGFDCSGFTMYVFKNFGISMSHSARAQSKLGDAVSFDKSSKSSILNNLEVGDLVFFLDYETMAGIGHCGIYIGDGEFIHASSGSGYCVKINSLLPGEYYNTRLYSARRVL